MPEISVHPKITGYRPLSEDEEGIINEIKEIGIGLGSLIEQLRAMPELDQRWVSIGCTDLQTGLMALVRSVARPTTF
jgi:hypothetical protein